MQQVNRGYLINSRFYSVSLDIFFSWSSRCNWRDFSCSLYENVHVFTEWKKKKLKWRQAILNENERKIKINFYAEGIQPKGKENGLFACEN